MKEKLELLNQRKGDNNIMKGRERVGGGAPSENTNTIYNIRVSQTIDLIDTSLKTNHITGNHVSHFCRLLSTENVQEVFEATCIGQVSTQEESEH